MAINVPEIKQKIIKFLEENGPCLPIHLTKITGMGLMFSSAILSELLNEKKIKQSHLKIGSSSLYLLPGQEEKLENFSDNLHGVEKEAFNLLKNQRFLEEEKLEPKIRVALKRIPDFSIPLKIDEKNIWKYFLANNEEISSMISKAKIKIEMPVKKEEIKEMRHVSNLVWHDIEKEDYKERINQIAKEIEEKQMELDKAKQEALAKAILSNKTLPELMKIEPNIEKKEQIIEETSKREKKIENKFFIEIKEKIESWGGNLIEAVYVGKKEVIIRAVLNGNELILLAFDKKRINENDVLKLIKKNNAKLPLFILSKGEVSKKMKELIILYKNIAGTGVL